MAKSSKKKRILTRRNFFRLTAAGMAGSAIDAFFIEPKILLTTRRELVLPELPPELDGLKIAQLTDFHYRPDKNHGLLEKVVAATNKEEVDLIALTGDYISADPSVFAPLLEHLSLLKSKHGIFACMGNHDGWSGSAETFLKGFREAGIELLINQNRLLTINQTELAIAATDFIWNGAPNPDQTLENIPADTPVIALVHEPDYFNSLRQHRRIDLQLSGHTHGGQCRVPLIGFAPAKVKYGQHYIYGAYTQADSTLFVSRGVGTVGINVRFSCAPELAILTLRSGKKA